MNIDLSIKLNEDNLLEFNSRKYLVKRLETFRKDIEKSASKKFSKKKERIEELTEYQSYEEAHEAFGYDYITYEELDRLRDYFENKNISDTKTVKSISLEILDDFINKLNRELRDFEWELKSDEEKAEIERNNKAYRLELKERCQEN